MFFTPAGFFLNVTFSFMSKKVYSKRFATDCFSEYYTEKALRSPVELDELKEYLSERATFEELKEQNSYFINELINTEKR